MKEFKDLNEIVNDFEDDDKDYKTVEDVVDELVERCSLDNVYPFHDDTLGLKENLSEEFLNTNLDDIDTDKFSEEIENIKEEAKIIQHYLNREVTEEIQEEIDEELERLGINDN